MIEYVFNDGTRATLLESLVITIVMLPVFVILGFVTFALQFAVWVRLRQESSNLWAWNDEDDYGLPDRRSV